MAAVASKKPGRRYTVPRPHELTAEEAWSILDEQAQRNLGVSGAEFIRKWDAGEYDGRNDTTLMRVAMLLPLVRKETTGP